MDLQHARNVLLSAYGSVKDQFRGLTDAHEEEADEQGPGMQPDYGFMSPRLQKSGRSAAGSWSWIERFGSGDADCGQFSEEEFLRRFGSYGAETAEVEPGELPAVVPATLMAPGNYAPELSEPSVLLTERHCRALATAVPVRHRWRRWHLLYSTVRDGISLQTLYRCRAVASYRANAASYRPV
jgi:hypothetical protein